MAEDLHLRNKLETKLHEIETDRLIHNSFNKLDSFSSHTSISNPLSTNSFNQDTFTAQPYVPSFATFGSASSEKIGGYLDNNFGNINYAREACGAVGGYIGGAAGGAIGGPVGSAMGGFGGEQIGYTLYDNRQTVGEVTHFAFMEIGKGWDD